jgi:Zn-finger nucleic acid-binding protein
VVAQEQTSKPCPNCQTELQTIGLSHFGSEPLQIERCHNCYGLFFELNEIQRFLDYAVVDDSMPINHQHIDTINKDRYPKTQNVKYLKCPICQNFMGRTLFGYRSGVVVDCCPKHGTWLDSGQATHLLEWKKMGGELLANQKKQSGEIPKNPPHQFPSTMATNIPTNPFELDLLQDVLSLLTKLLD